MANIKTNPIIPGGDAGRFAPNGGSVLFAVRPMIMQT